MAKQQHTPAPLKVRRSTAGGYEIGPVKPESDADREQTAWVKRVGDARLYAAAPELLEALESTLAIAEAHYHKLPDDGPEQDHLMTSVIEPASAAIAKATGESL